VIRCEKGRSDDYGKTHIEKMKRRNWEIMKLKGKGKRKGKSV
jgi:hypothetical protein